MARDRADTELEMPALGHPTEDALVALAAGQVSPGERNHLVAHLDGCVVCRELLAALSDDETPADSMIGREVGGYRIERFLAKGGMGAVYEARALDGSGAVAIKVMLATSEPTHEARLRAEARALMSVQNDHVVKVMGLRTLGTQVPCLMMELIDGESLSARLKRKPPGLIAALGWIDQLLEGLEACHEKGVMHRDLKPSNVLVIDSPRGALLKLIDFGLARDKDSTRITSPTALVGSAGFIAPELLSGASASPSTDLYAVGCIAWRILTGGPLFTAPGNHPLDVLKRHKEEPPPPLRSVLPQASPRLEAWLDELVARSPEQRFRSATLARQALDDVRDSLDTTVIEKTPLRGRALREDSDTQLEAPTLQQRPTRDDRPALRPKK